MGEEQCSVIPHGNRDRLYHHNTYNIIAVKKKFKELMEDRESYDNRSVRIVDNSFMCV